MKIKQLPEDFQVEELSDACVEASGPHALYRLRKRGLGTPEAIRAICERWKLPLRSAGHGGLKDRHALTTQHLTLLHGPARNLELPGIQLKYLGQRSHPFRTTDARGNRFQLTLRALSGGEAAAAREALAEVRLDGVPNYFDDQRFGSVTPDGRFVARALIDGDYEEAVRLALAAPYAHDTADAKHAKRLLRSDWGDWARLKDRLPSGEARTIANHLASHPNDFRGAVARLRDDLKSIYLNAYQSHLWNKMLARWLATQCRPDQLYPVSVRLGPVPFCRQLDDEQRAVLHAMHLPLPSARLQLAHDHPLRAIVEEVLAAEGLSLRDLKLKHFRTPFFSKGDRAAFILPTNLDAREEPDELNEGRLKLILHFDLPRGCYATMVVKRLGGDQSAPDSR